MCGGGGMPKKRSNNKKKSNKKKKGAKGAKKVKNQGRRFNLHINADGTVEGALLDAHWNQCAAIGRNILTKKSLGSMLPEPASSLIASLQSLYAALRKASLEEGRESIRALANKVIDRVFVLHLGEGREQGEALLKSVQKLLTPYETANLQATKAVNNAFLAIQKGCIMHYFLNEARCEHAADLALLFRQNWQASEEEEALDARLKEAIQGGETYIRQLNTATLEVSTNEEKGSLLKLGTQVFNGCLKKLDPTGLFFEQVAAVPLRRAFQEIAGKNTGALVMMMDLVQVGMHEGLVPSTPEGYEFKQIRHVFKQIGGMSQGDAWFFVYNLKIVRLFFQKKASIEQLIRLYASLSPIAKGLDIHQRKELLGIFERTREKNTTMDQYVIAMKGLSEIPSAVYTHIHVGSILMAVLEDLKAGYSGWSVLHWCSVLSRQTEMREEYIAKAEKAQTPDHPAGKHRWMRFNAPKISANPAVKGQSVIDSSKMHAISIAFR